MRQQIADLKKDIILEVATKHFEANGYEASQISKIAKDAEVSIGTIYGFFESKEGLFRANILRDMKNAHAQMRTMIEQSSAEPREHLKAILTYYFTMIESKKIPFQEILLSSPLQMGEYCHAICDDEENPMLESYKLIAKEFEKLDVQTPLVSKDYLQLAISFRNAGAGYIERWALLNDIKLTDKIDECLTIFLKGVTL